MSCEGCKKLVETGLKGAVGITKAVLRIDRAPMDVIRARWDKCRECPHSGKRNIGGRLTITNLSPCKLCRCFIEYKTRLASEVCPDNPPRWGAV